MRSRRTLDRWFRFCYGAEGFDLGNEHIWPPVFIPRRLVLKHPSLSFTLRPAFSFTLIVSMNAPTEPMQAFNVACARKTRCENRWTAPEDKILLAQVLKGTPFCDFMLL